MPNVTRPEKTTQAAAAAVGADFARVMANVEEAAAETLSRAWREAQDAIARDLARIKADVDARFEEFAKTTRAAVGPGTLIGDFLALAGERATQPEQEAALERFATVLGLMPRQLMRSPMKQGLRLRAKLALTTIAKRESLARSQILLEEIPFAVLEAIAAFHEHRTRRDGRKWRTDQNGKLLRFIPANRYTLPDLRGPARDHLRDLARGCLEDELIERAGLTDADDNLVSQNWADIEGRGHWRDDSTAAREEDEAAAVTAQEHDERSAPLLCAPSAEDVLLGAALLERIALLTPRERDVFSLLELEPREIAEKLAISEPSVRRLTYSIQKKFSMA